MIYPSEDRTGTVCLWPGGRLCPSVYAVDIGEIPRGLTHYQFMIGEALHSAKIQTLVWEESDGTKCFADVLEYEGPVINDYTRKTNPLAVAKCRTLPCIACPFESQRYPTEAHHVTTRKAGGGDTPTNLMPLCSLHHKQWHDEGPGSMIRSYPDVLAWLEENGRDDVIERSRR